MFEEVQRIFFALYMLTMQTVPKLIKVFVLFFLTSLKVVIKLEKKVLHWQLHIACLVSTCSNSS